MKPAQRWILDVDTNKAERLFIETESSTPTRGKPRKTVDCVILPMWSSKFIGLSLNWQMTKVQ